MRKKKASPALTIVELALNQVDFANRFGRIETSLNSLVQGLTDLMNNAHKANSALVKTIEELKSRCADLEHKLANPVEMLTSVESPDDDLN